MYRAIVLCGVLCGIHLSCWAESPVAGDKAKPVQYTSYYQIEEPEEPEEQIGAQSLHQFQSPIEMMRIAAKSLNQAASLLRWAFQKQGWPEPSESYDRRGQFGTWLGGRTYPSCLNTRAQVLMRDSDGKVKLSPNGCKVRQGVWHDPYGGMDHSDAGEIQVDHMVPLKNAYLSGAWKWDHKTRCAYTNFMANSFHLISVGGRENQQKGDGTPADWLPANAAYRCQYLKNWLSVKMIWGLIMNPEESEAIKHDIEEFHCSADQFTMTATTLADQRKAITERMGDCR